MRRKVCTVIVKVFFARLRLDGTVKVGVVFFLFLKIWNFHVYGIDCKINDVREGVNNIAFRRIERNHKDISLMQIVIIYENLPYFTLYGAIVHRDPTPEPVSM